AEYASAYGRRCRDFSSEALASLQAYPWPGNVRELRNLVERIAILNPGAATIERRHLPPLLRRGRHAAENDFASLHEARSAYERDYILKKLAENSGNMTRTAEVLGLERSHLYRKMKSLGMAVSGN
ncbi:MAG: helix-turn-helix domain-containing protein, partial [Terriglobales bacterium]